LREDPKKVCNYIKVKELYYEFSRFTIGYFSLVTVAQSIMTLILLSPLALDRVKNLNKVKENFKALASKYFQYYGECLRLTLSKEELKDIMKGLQDIL